MAASAAVAVQASPSAQDVPLFQALEWIGEAPESRDGYSRGQFKHWTSCFSQGLDLADGCDTRREVILAEAKLAPDVGARCALSGGGWFSEYDQVCEACPDTTLGPLILRRALRPTLGR
ncbi:hypothetical protein B6E66_33250 [Streptomyces maremycinicus]|nr:hypothetical protein B6E66_33250 [Streptomyces sp. B9173]